jgi:hypothetical protein
MTQSTDAKVTVMTRNSRPGALTVRKRIESCLVTASPLSCSADHLIEQHDQQHPEHEIDDARGRRRTSVQIEALL